MQGMCGRVIRRTKIMKNQIKTPGEMRTEDIIATIIVVATLTFFILRYFTQ